MNIKKTVFFLICSLVVFTPNNLFTQEKANIVLEQDSLFPFENSSPQYANNVGFTASFFSGIGFHYKRDITPKQSLKVVILGWYESGENNNSHPPNYVAEGFLSLGLEYQYHIIRKSKFDFYALIGARTWYEEDNSAIDRINSVGIGLGNEFKLSKHFVINIEGGFVGRQTVTSKYEFDITTTRKKFFGFAAGVGLGFIF